MAKIKKKKAPPTTPQLVEQAAVLTQAIVRLKAADDDGNCKCVTCGVIRPWNRGMQGGHFISRGWISTKLLKENIHPQCDACNGGFGGKSKGNLIQYTLYMIEMHGKDFVDELETLKHQTKKYGRPEIRDIILELKRQKKELEGEL